MLAFEFLMFMRRCSRASWRANAISPELVDEFLPAFLLAGEEASPPV
jgi:hypothetical protein